jgi:hypothetical protein
VRELGQEHNERATNIKDRCSELVVARVSWRVGTGRRSGGVRHGGDGQTVERWAAALSARQICVAPRSGTAGAALENGRGATGDEGETGGHVGAMRGEAAGRRR